jgi:hypothetical protein
MRARAALCAIACAAAAGCTGAGPDRSPVARTESPIAYGSADSSHTAVVSVLAPVGTNSLQECSGSIVQVKNGNGYVLTAAHCCNMYIPTVVVVSNDYTIGEQYVFGAPPLPPVYPVVSGSIYYDAKYTGPDHDFCMLRFSGAPSGTAVLALPPASGDGLTLGASIEHIGFGQTDTSTTNTGRRTGTDTVDLSLTALVFQFSQGGASHIPGTCDGDSGGPSLLPAGQPQAQQVVVGVQSYGNASTCASETLGGASRVLSEIGPGQFITSYLADAPTGIRVGAPPPPPPPVPATGPAGLIAIALGLYLAGWRRIPCKARP